MTDTLDSLLCDKVRNVAQNEVEIMLKRGQLAHVSVNLLVPILLPYEEFADWICNGSGTITEGMVRTWVRDPKLWWFRKQKLGKRAFVDVDFYLKNKPENNG